MPPLQYKASPRHLGRPTADPPGSPPEDGDSSSGLWGAVSALLLVGVVVLGVRIYSKSHPEPTAVDADAGDVDAALVEAQKKLPPRCKAISKDAFVVGEQAQARPRPPLLEGQDAGVLEDDEEFDELSPFAVELGRGAAMEGGFAVGALRDGEGGSVAMIATVGADGSGGRLVRLGRSRGDFDAPVVSGYKSSVLAAMFQPHAGGRAIRLARVSGEQVIWGLELSEGQDESLAVDIGTVGSRSVVVWDDVSKDGKRTMVLLSSFDPETMKPLDVPHPISPPKTDAESPRVVARPGGYWVVYAVVGEARKAKDEDTGSDGETIAPRYLEVLPLDEQASPVSLPRAVTPRDGHALAFDVEPGEDGGLLIAYRDDDTPSGSNGGRVLSVSVRLSGATEPKELVEETTSSGVPDLFPGWLALSSLSGATRIAPLSVKGELLAELRAEPDLGNGEVLAASGAGLLVGRPSGKAMKLSVLRCSPDEPALDAGVEAGAKASGAP